MLTIRLLRVGRKHNPAFRVVVVDSRKPPKSLSYIEALGFWDKSQKKSQINAERAKHWIKNGAKTSDTVYNMLVEAKVIEGKKKHVAAKKKGVEEKPAEAAPVAGK